MDRREFMPGLKSIVIPDEVTTIGHDAFGSSWQKHHVTTKAGSRYLPWQLFTLSFFASLRRRRNF